MPISHGTAAPNKILTDILRIPVKSIRAPERLGRASGDCGGSDRNRQEEVGSEMGFGAKRR
jgi:hypothetical protein